MRQPHVLHAPARTSLRAPTAAARALNFPQVASRLGRREPRPGRGGHDEHGRVAGLSQRLLRGGAARRQVRTSRGRGRRRRCGPAWLRAPCPAAPCRPPACPPIPHDRPLVYVPAVLLLPSLRCSRDAACTLCAANCAEIIFMASSGTIVKGSAIGGGAGGARGHDDGRAARGRGGRSTARAGEATGRPAMGHSTGARRPAGRRVSAARASADGASRHDRGGVPRRSEGPRVHGAMRGVWRGHTGGVSCACSCTLVSASRSLTNIPFHCAFTGHSRAAGMPPRWDARVRDGRGSWPRRTVSRVVSHRITFPAPTMRGPLGGEI